MSTPQPMPYRHSVSVAGAVVDQQNRLLAIQRRDNGKWEIPGGVLEADETPEAGAVREVLEETGVKVEVVRLSGVYKNMRRGIIALVFRCEAVEGEPTPTDEATAVAWLTVDEIQEQVDEAYSVRFLDALAPDGPKLRSHDGVRLL